MTLISSPEAITVQNYLPRPAEGESMAAFHDSNYVAFLRIISPDNMVRPCWPCWFRILMLASCASALGRSHACSRPRTH